MFSPTLSPSRLSSALHLLSLLATVQSQFLARDGDVRIDATADGGTATAGNGGNVTGNGNASGGNATGGKGGSIGDIGGTSFTVGIGPSASSSINAALTSQATLSSGAVAGIVAVMSIVATCVVLALFLYIKRRRPWAAKKSADSFKALHNGSETSISNTDRTLSSNSNHNGAQIEPEMQEGAHTRANTSPLATPESSLRFNTLGLLASPSRHGIDRSNMEVAAEVSGPPNYVGCGEQRRVAWLGMDGGVRSAGGRSGPDPVAEDDANFDSPARYRLTHSVSSASTLPPSYRSSFVEA